MLMNFGLKYIRPCTNIRIRIASIQAFTDIGVYHVCEFYLVILTIGFIMIFYFLNLTILVISIQIQVGILKRVLEEVEKVMNDFKTMLFKSMEDPQIDLTNVIF